ncbi:MAG: hypothetical protein HN796_04310 [Gemmatimonadetes bacterium]|jgi:hypothetical protein|nr:hypothetical protein [Gemmatimonadota bacterium]
MIMDSLLEFADGEDLSQTTGTYLATNQIDLQEARDIGNGKTLYLVIQIDVAVEGTSSTVNFRLRSDSTAATHATTSTAHIETGAIAEATLVAGYQAIIPLPLEGNAYERYLGLQAIVGTATTTAGTYSAFLTFDPSGNKSYPDATN